MYLYKSKSNLNLHQQEHLKPLNPPPKKRRGTNYTRFFLFFVARLLLKIPELA